MKLCPLASGPCTFPIACKRDDYCRRKNATISAFIIEEEIQMSMALWCDKGDHAFSAKDPLKQHFSQTQTVTVPTGNNYGRTTYEERREVTEELDICGPCWSRANPFSPDSPKVQKGIAFADQTNEDYLRGFRDAKEESE